MSSSLAENRGPGAYCPDHRTGVVAVGRRATEPIWCGHARCFERSVGSGIRESGLGEHFHGDPLSDAIRRLVTFCSRLVEGLGQAGI